MARIRSVKPEFWADEKLAPLGPLDRLVFLGLISQADDAGRLLDSVKQLDGLLFPATEDTVRESLATLSDLGVIERGNSASGQAVIQIVNWSKHQKVDHPNLRSALPPIKGRRDKSRSSAPAKDKPPTVASDSRDVREDSATDSRYDLRSGPTTYDLRPASEDLRAREDSPSADHVNGWTPNDEHRERAAELGVDLEATVRKYLGRRQDEGREPSDGDFAYWLENEPQFQQRDGEPQRGPTSLPAVRWTPPEDEPAHDPAAVRAGLELVKSVVEKHGGIGDGGKKPKAPPSSAVPPVIEDPAVAKAREQERERQKSLIARAR